MQKQDKFRLQHMLDAANEAVSFIENKTQVDLVQNRMLVLSLIKDIEIIGEAAVKISDELKNSYPDIPWVDIIGMRNRLIHTYFDVDLEVVWKTVTEDIPPLVNFLTEILS